MMRLSRVITVGEKTYGAKRQIVLPIPAAILKDGKWEPFDVRTGKFD